MIKMSDLSDTVLMSMVETDTSVLFVGAPGIGKTSRIEQFGQDTGLPVVTVQTTGRDSSDVAGFPMPVKEGDGQRVTRYTLSPFVTRILDTKSDRGIIVFDELPQAETLMQKACAPAFFEKRLGDSKIPSGWVVWATGNRVQDRAGVNKMVSHLRNRISVIEVNSDMDAFRDWATRNGVHHMIIAFADFRRGVVFTNAVPSGDDPYPTPRSLTLAGRFLAKHAQGSELPSDPISRAVAAGYIGEGATSDLYAFLENHQYLPEEKDIINDPMRAKVPPSDNLGAHFAASALAVSIVDKTNAEQVAQYVGRLARELQVSCYLSIIKKAKGSGVNSPTLRKWLQENHALVTVSLN
jgi:hypothetical protein